MALEGIQAVAPVLAESVLNALWQGLAVTALVWVVLSALRRASAATVHAAWLATLAVVVALAGLASPPANGRALLHLGSGWPLLLVSVWAAIAGLLLLRLFWSYAYIEWLARTCSPLPAAEQERAARLTGSRSIHIYSSRETPVPVTIGLLRPAILLPQALTEQLSPAERDQVILHEWAHVRRRDPWIHLAIEVIKALFFFHPAVWFISRRLNLEREIACDDAVVSATGEPVPYAGCLAKLAEMNACPPALASGAVAGARDLLRRVERLLHRQDRTGFSVPRFGAAAAVLLLAVLVSGQAPALVETSASAGFALATPHPAIAASRQAILAEVSLRSAEVLMQAAEQRLQAVNQQMRLAALAARSVPMSRVACGQPPAPIVILKFNRI